MISLLLQDSLGKRLHEARTLRGQNVLDVAFLTKIPAERVRELENDDYSNFANLTYAKSFLKLYAGHLDLDISEQLREFNHAAPESDQPTEFLTPVGTPSQAELVQQQAGSAGMVNALKALPFVVTLAGLTWLCVWLYKHKDIPAEAAVAQAEVASVTPPAVQQAAVKTQPTPAPEPTPQPLLTAGISGSEVAAVTSPLPEPEPAHTEPAPPLPPPPPAAPEPAQQVQVLPAVAAVPGESTAGEASEGGFRPKRNP